MGFYSIITGVRFADENKIIYLEIEVGQLLPLGLVNTSTLHWQGPPTDLASSAIRLNFSFIAFRLDKVIIKTGFLSGFQVFPQDKTLQLRVFAKQFANFSAGTFNDKETIYVNEEKITRRLFLDQKRPKVSKRPGKISTNWNYDVYFGSSNQDCKKLKFKVLFRVFFHYQFR